MFDEAVPVRGRKATKWRKGLYFNSEFYHESAFPYKENAGSTCKTLGLRYWNSDDEKTPPPQAVPHPFAVVTCYTALQTDILYIHIYSRFVEPNIFTIKISN